MNNMLSVNRNETRVLSFTYDKLRTIYVYSLQYCLTDPTNSSRTTIMQQSYICTAAFFRDLLFFFVFVKNNICRVN